MCKSWSREFECVKLGLGGGGGEVEERPSLWFRLLKGFVV